MIIINEKEKAQVRFTDLPRGATFKYLSPYAVIYAMKVDRSVVDTTNTSHNAVDLITGELFNIVDSEVLVEKIDINCSIVD